MKAFSMKRIFLFVFTSSLLLTSCGSIANKNSNYLGSDSIKVRTEEDDEFANDEVPEPIHFVYKNDYGADDNDYFFYSDDYFRHRATAYNEHLATLSVHMTKYSQNPGNPNSVDDHNWYMDQSDRVNTFLYSIGFREFQANEDYRSRTAFDTIGLACASRVIKEGDNQFTVIACVVRSGGYFFEWENNVFLGTGENSDYMHEGWYNAALKQIAFIDDYIKMEKITGQIKLWMSGFSRGGAVTNLTAGLLDNKLTMDDRETRNHIYEGVSLKREDILAYTFEAPQGANFNSKTVANPKDELYNNIFNIVNPNDPVTKVAMNDFGFTRFGIDKFITTKFFDAKNYEENRRSTGALYAVTHDEYSWACDKLTTYNIPLSKAITTIATFTDLVSLITKWIMDGNLKPDLVEEDTKKVNYDANIVLTTAIDHIMGYLDTRENYCNRYQNFARALMRMLMPDVKGSEDVTFREFLVLLIMQGIAYLAYGNTDLIIDWKKYTTISDSDIESVLWLVSNVFLEFPGELLTLGFNFEDIFDNHSTNLNVAHAQAQDSYYIDWYNNNHPDATISKVPYRKHSSFFYIDAIDINDVWVQDFSAGIPGYHTAVDVNGSDTGASDIAKCLDGYAVGYYNYLNYERTITVLPADHDYYYEGNEYSWDPWHLIQCYKWNYIDNQTYYRYHETIVDEYFNCDAGPFGKHINHMVDPE